MSPKRKPQQETHPPDPPFSAVESKHELGQSTPTPVPVPSVPSGGDGGTVKKKSVKRRVVEIDVASDDSGDHTSDQELSTDEDSVGSLVDFVVDDELPMEQLEEEEEKEKEIEIIVSAVYDNGVRRSTRNRKTVERYADSDYEELMCADADTQIALESSENEEEENEETETATEELETTDTISDSDN
jgi:hypothetical protein